jgi:hypothetical protein
MISQQGVHCNGFSFLITNSKGKQEVQLKIQKNKRHPGIPTIRPYGGAYKTMT